MSGPDVMFPEEQEQIANVCQRLHRDANAKAVLLIGRDGQPIADATVLVGALRGDRTRDSS